MSYDMYGNPMYDFEPMRDATKFLEPIEVLRIGDEKSEYYQQPRKIKEVTKEEKEKKKKEGEEKVKKDAIEQENLKKKKNDDFVEANLKKRIKESAEARANEPQQARASSAAPITSKPTTSKPDPTTLAPIGKPSTASTAPLASAPLASAPLASAPLASTPIVPTPPGVIKPPTEYERGNYVTFDYIGDPANTSGVVEDKSFIYTDTGKITMTTTNLSDKVVTYKIINDKGREFNISSNLINDNRIQYFGERTDIPDKIGITGYEDESSDKLPGEFEFKILGNKEDDIIDEETASMFYKTLTYKENGKQLGLITGMFTKNDKNNVYISKVNIDPTNKNQGLCQILLEKYIKYVEEKYKDINNFTLIITDEIVETNEANKTKGKFVSPACLCYVKTFIKSDYDVFRQKNDKTEDYEPFTIDKCYADNKKDIEANLRLKFVKKTVSEPSGGINITSGGRRRHKNITNIYMKKTLKKNIKKTRKIKQSKYVNKKYRKTRKNTYKKRNAKKTRKVRHFKKRRMIGGFLPIDECNDIRKMNFDFSNVENIQKIIALLKIELKKHEQYSATHSEILRYNEYLYNNGERPLLSIASHLATAKSDEERKNLEVEKQTIKTKITNYINDKKNLMNLICDINDIDIGTEFGFGE